MAEMIKDGFNGANNWLKINDDGSINTTANFSISGLSFTTGSVVYQGTNPWNVFGSIYNLSTTPTLISQNPAKVFLYLPYSGTGYGVGSQIGSIIQYIGEGSYVKVLSYDADNNLTGVGSWC